MGETERYAAQKGLIDCIATAYATKDNEAIIQLIQMLKVEHGGGQYPVIGYEQRLKAREATLVNGYILHYLDYDDVHSDVRGHATSVIIPTLLAVSNQTKRSYDRFLESYIIGIEVAARIGRTIGSKHYEKGWHTSATIGIVGATVASAYYLELDIESIANAIGIAITEMSGLRAQFGTDVKPLHIGLAAQKAYMAVRYSQSKVINGHKDMLPALFDTYSELCYTPESLIKGIKESWAIVNPGLWFKLYPCCSANYHAIDAVLMLQNKHSIIVQDIELINVIFPTHGDAALKFKKPVNGLEGRFSVEYVIATLLYNDQLTLEDFCENTINTQIQRIMTKVQRIYNDEIVPEANALPKGRYTIVEIVTKEGDIFRERVDAPKGSPNNPLTIEELVEKLSIYSTKHARNIQHLFNLTNTDELITYIVTGG
ncbi:MmgE/PrpD family protein [Staphylococcus gallinarum]|uniref:MmgE/PrpD family protein n=1 Tax=Staphylococcus gallinarum TaxID=1293 RepID=UPI0021751D60|nr:MmgE/PrpD family protein [Staphylococcus gallinarum]